MSEVRSQLESLHESMQNALDELDSKHIISFRNNMQVFLDALYRLMEDIPLEEEFSEELALMWQNEILPNITQEQATYIRLKYGIRVEDL